jgi:hypothetical protein
MKAALGALVLLAVTQGAEAEMYRCHQPDGAISFRQEPCPLAEMTAPEAAARVPAARVPVAAQAASAAPSTGTAPSPRPAERPVSVPSTSNPVAPGAAPAAADDDVYVKPTKRKRDVLEIAAQFERCRADAPGFAETSAAIYAAWTRRHAGVLAEYDKQLAAKVWASRRGETTLPLRLCTEDWLRAIEPLTRVPDPRFSTVEKTWQVFMGALMTGDRAAALKCLGDKAEARWRQRTEAMSDDDLRQVGASIQALKVQWGDDYEKEGLVADTGNRVIGIAFRNVNEEWKITELGGAPAAALPAQ